MRTFSVTIQVFILLNLQGFTVQAAPLKPQANKATLAAKSQPKNGTQLTTDMRFDDMTVRGLRQSPFGATATIESDKVPKEFVDYRSDFNDRIAKSRSGR